MNESTPTLGKVIKIDEARIRVPAPGGAAAHFTALKGALHHHGRSDRRPSEAVATHEVFHVRLQLRRS
ncbi:hypothetical protein QFW77_16920 [Luteimonas sp. RD2P54]|uniref:Uncharacterized protein n=1 Tax=Luteimonas endophytica TaxID=3042023 RepID=A0ABT6JCU1_9GAMM|nr:hypothetical protein [Luteimonas endophytica]MDH5824655.1 hypothetical protein [Luteimonas endophytica]